MTRSTGIYSIFSQGRKITMPRNATGYWTREISDDGSTITFRQLDTKGKEVFKIIPQNDQRLITVPPGIGGKFTREISNKGKTVIFRKIKPEVP